MVFSPLTPETLPGRGLAVVALHLPLQHIREQGRAVERGVQWGGVMGLCCYCTTVTAPPLRFLRCGFTVSLTPFGRGNHMVIPLLSSPPPPETHSKRGNMALHPR